MYSSSSPSPPFHASKVNNSYFYLRPFLFCHIFLFAPHTLISSSIIHFFEYPSFWINDRNIKKTKKFVTSLFLKRIPNRKSKHKAVPEGRFRGFKSSPKFKKIKQTKINFQL